MGAEHARQLAALMAGLDGKSARVLAALMPRLDADLARRLATVMTGFGADNARRLMTMMAGLGAERAERLAAAIARNEKYARQTVAVLFAVSGAEQARMLHALTGDLDAPQDGKPGSEV
jgi:hypothetical protein